jgi:hypothetical protein
MESFVSPDKTAQSFVLNVGKNGRLKQEGLRGRMGGFSKLGD